MRYKALLIAVVASLFLPAVTAVAPARAGINEAVAYIRVRQTPDGGFCEPGRGEAGQDATTAWCIMALSAAGVNPSSLRSQGRSPLDFLATQSANWRSVTDYERTLLAVVAGGGNPYSFGGMDLVAKVRSFQRPGGNIGDAVNSNAFGILAYRAAGVEIPRGALQWQKNAQNRDGGWGNSPGAASNPDMTAASIMALRAGGVDPGDPSIAAALAYLRATQNPDGGFSFQSTSSDVSATSWCVQALVAVGQDPAGPSWSKNGNTPWSFLLSMQASDGHFTWMRGRDLNPLWTTAYAVCALARKPFPVAVCRGGSQAAVGGEFTSPQSGSGGGVPGGQSSGEETVQDQQGDGESMEEGGEAGAADTQEAEGCEGTILAEEEKEPGRGVHPAVWAAPTAGFAVLVSVGVWYFLRRRRLAGRGAGGAPGG